MPSTSIWIPLRIPRPNVGRAGAYLKLASRVVNTTHPLEERVMRGKRTVVGIHLLVLGILACNLQGGQGNTPDLPGTITAQALMLQARETTPVPPIGASSE